MGYTSGAVLWYPVEKPIHSTLYLKNEAAPIQLRAIRFFDKGIVYKSAPDLPVVFVKWEDVIKIEKPTEKPWQGVIKKWFDFPNDEIIKIKEKSLEEDKKK